MFVFASIIIEAIAAIITFRAAGAGHGTYLPAKLLLAYSLLSTRATRDISSAAFIAAAVQFPLYGEALAWAQRRRVLWQVVIVLTCQHLVAVTLCMLLLDERWR